MLLKNLTEVWISEYSVINDHGEKTKKWNFKEQDTVNKTAFLNLQQDVNELDRTSAGEIDYSIENARTDQNYDISKSNGVSTYDISKLDSFEPEYIVREKIKIGNTILYKLEKNNAKV